MHHITERSRVWTQNIDQRLSRTLYDWHTDTSVDKFDIRLVSSVFFESICCRIFCIYSIREFIAPSSSQANLACKCMWNCFIFFVLSPTFCHSLSISISLSCFLSLSFSLSPHLFLFPLSIYVGCGRVVWLPADGWACECNESCVESRWDWGDSPRSDWAVYMSPIQAHTPSLSHSPLHCMLRLSPAASPFFFHFQNPK